MARPLNTKEIMMKKMRWTKQLSLKQAVLGILICVALYLAFSVIERPKKVEHKLLSQKTDSVMTLNFTGNSMMGRGIAAKGEKKGYESFTASMKDYFSSADYTFTNVEAAVVKDTNKYNPIKKKDLETVIGTSMEAVNQLADSGVNAFAFANDHTYDYRLRGLKDCLSQMKKTDLVYAGIGSNLEETTGFKKIECNGKNIGFISITDLFTVRSMDVNDPERAGVLNTAYSGYNEMVAQSAQENDLTIVYVHWGSLDSINAENRQEELAHAFADAGADIIIGTHPNVVQSAEIYRNSLIMYSLGNLISDENYFYSKCSVMARYSEDKNGDRIVKFVPVKITDGIPDETDSKFYKNMINRTLVKKLPKEAFSYDENGYLQIKF